MDQSTGASEKGAKSCRAGAHDTPGIRCARLRLPIQDAGRREFSMAAAEAAVEQPGTAGDAGTGFSGWNPEKQRTKKGCPSGAPESAVRMTTGGIEMKRLKSIFLATALAVALGFGVSACDRGGGAGDTDQPITQPGGRDQPATQQDRPETAPRDPAGGAAGPQDPARPQDPAVTPQDPAGPQPESPPPPAPPQDQPQQPGN